MWVRKLKVHFADHIFLSIGLSCLLHIENTFGVFFSNGQNVGQDIFFTLDAGHIFFGTRNRAIIFFELHIPPHTHTQTKSNTVNSEIIVMFLLMEILRQDFRHSNKNLHFNIFQERYCIIQNWLKSQKLKFAFWTIVNKIAIIKASINFWIYSSPSLKRNAHQPVCIGFAAKFDDWFSLIEWG